MKTVKAGCILVDVKTKKIAIIYRDHLNDYSFPKGHLEDGEELKECAIRETAEETKRVAKIIDSINPYIDEYKTPRGEDCVCYMYVAIDKGVSDNTSTDTHETIWVPFNDVEKYLSYPSLKDNWNAVKSDIEKLF